METFFLYVTIGIFFYFLTMAFWYGLTLLLAYADILHSYKEVKYGNIFQLLEKANYLPISIIMPAFNEQKRILNAIYSVLQSHYKKIELIVINDGSTDNTMDLLINELALYEIPCIVRQVIKTSPIKHLYKSRRFGNLMVIDKENNYMGTAADAVNCGVNAAATPVILTVDGDTVLEPEALSNILFRFLSKKHCITVGGAIYILNGNEIEHGRMLTNLIPTDFIPAFQSVEYMRAFTYGRAGLNVFAGALCNSGAFTLNEASIVREVGGYDTANFAYDAELTMKLHDLTRSRKYPTKIYFDSNAIAWTTVPATLRSYWNQRNRWQRGMLKSVLKFKHIFFNPKYGAIGMIIFPAYVLFDLMGPIVEFISYIIFILIFLFFPNLFSFPNICLFLFFAWGYFVVMTIGAFYLNLMTFNKFKKLVLLRVTGLVTAEMFGFRQFRAACCFFSTLQYFYHRILGKPI